MEENSQLDKIIFQYNHTYKMPCNILITLSLNVVILGSNTIQCTSKTLDKGYLDTYCPIQGFAITIKRKINVHAQSQILEI